MGDGKTARPGAVNHDHARLYADMVSALEKTVGAPKLAELFARIRQSGLSAPLPVAQDPEVLRLLKRMGRIPEYSENAVAQKLAEEFLRDFSDSVSRTPAQISVVLRLYASGMYGLVAEPICGASPLCGKCGITRFCEYYNRTPVAGSVDRLPASKRFIRSGETALSERELLVLLLGGGRATAEHEKTAEALLLKFGTLRGVANATYQEMAGLRDVPESAALRVAAAAACHRLITEEKRLAKPVVRSGKDFFDLFHQKLRDSRKERFYIVLLDQQHRIMREEEISVGSLVSAQVHPREVFAPVIRDSAAAVAFVHNHPSGDSRPSDSDIALTKKLCEAANLLGVRVLDHVIVGDGTYTSFVDDNLL